MNDRQTLIESWKPELRAAYDDDPRNGARQSFDDYWRWAQAFLVTGGAGQPGWLDQVDVALRGVRDGEAAARLRERMLAVGLAIAAEWAKQARYRRIHSTVLQGSPNLQTWGSQVQRSAAADAGDGRAIEQALATIERDVRNALRG